MALKIARLANLLLSGMLAGNEFSGLVAIYPALHRPPPLTLLQAERPIYHRYGKIMPFYMSATLASFLSVFVRNQNSPAFRLTFAGMLRFAAMLAITLTRNLPINKRIEDPPTEEVSFEEFRQFKERWLHAIRKVLNITGLVCARLGALSAPGTSGKLERYGKR